MWWVVGCTVMQKRNIVRFREKEAGFSLIEVAIALAVLSILIIPLMRMYTLEVKEQRIEQDKYSVSTASTALIKYALLHGRYPAPATALAQGNANFGKEAVEPALGWADCQNAATPATTVCKTTTNTLGGAGVLIGVLPFVEINVPYTSVLDANGNALTYAVTESLTKTASYNEDGGAVNITSLTIDPITKAFLDTNLYPVGSPHAQFVVVNHGPDARGSKSQAGALVNACGTNANSTDFENCNRDGVFRTNTLPNSTENVPFEAAGALHFDDYVAETDSTASGIWSYLPDTASTDLSIRDRMGGNVATGNCDGRYPCIPVSRLDVYGDGSVAAPVVRATKINTKRICGRGNSGADAPGSGSFGCISDYSKLRNDKPSGTDNLVTTCVTSAGGVVTCTAAMNVWNDSSLPPWFTPNLVMGTPPVLTNASTYWLNTSEHGEFHRGNGIRCIDGAAMGGIFNYDEACNNVASRPVNIDAASATRLSSCGTGTYARGILASGQIFCQSVAANH